MLLHEHLITNENDRNGMQHDFKKAIFPVVQSLVTGHPLMEKEQDQENPTLVLKAVSEIPASMRAGRVLSDCASLINCYNHLRGAPNSSHPETKTRVVFEADQKHTTKAFDAAKKFVIKQIQMNLAGQPNTDIEQTVVDEDEIILAQKVMNRSKDSNQQIITKDTQALGSTLHDIEKVVLKLSKLTE